MPDANTDIGSALVQTAKAHLIEESLPRIRKCLHALTEDQIWHRPNENVVSVGNLILHLCGNVRQHIISGLGGAADNRKRDEEFTTKGPMPAEELLKRIEDTLAEAALALDNLDTATLLRPRVIQGNETTALQTITHVVEHFSYHVGQITYFVKTTENIDTGYYPDQDLNITG